MKCPVCQNKMCQLLVSWVCDHCDKVKATAVVPTQKVGINDWCKRSDLFVQLYFQNQPVGKKTPVHFVVEQYSHGKDYYRGTCDVFYTGHVDYFTVQDCTNKVRYEYSTDMTITGCCTCNMVLRVE